MGINYSNKSTILAIAILHFFIRAEAQAASRSSTERSSSFLIIGGGGKEISDAVYFVEIMKKYSPQIKIGNGFPKLIQSSEFPGLNPGFNIAVLGHCPSEVMAKKWLKLLRVDIPGAYLRKVSLVANETTCPTLNNISEKDSDLRAKLQKAVENSVPLIRWSIYQNEVDACPVMGLEVAFGATPLATKIFEDKCTQGDQEGSTINHKVMGFYEAGSRSFAAIRVIHDWVNNGEGTTKVYGYACGMIQELASFSGGGAKQYIDPIVKIVTNKSNSHSWESFELSLAYDDEKIVKQVNFDPASCLFNSIPVN